jgi:uncharacterized protein (UPF0276 family)
MRAGIGLRLPHLAGIAATRPGIGWLEIHPENFLGNAHATELLLDIRRDYAISVHTVGISVGSADGLDTRHLQRLRALVNEVDPVLVSGHLAWSSLAGAYLNDLLPLPLTSETLTVVAGHVLQVQDALKRRYLIENPSSYVGFGASTMNEAEFLRELVQRTGCGLLCDVGNVYVSAHNMQSDARAYLDALPADAVHELHLGGFTAEDDESVPGGDLLVDTHATGIAEPVWALYAYAIERFGRRPTLIEWDNDLPPLDTLRAEAHRAERVCAGALETVHGCAR